jgi:glucan phosphoethanolaminetransferase (alkaline phosphatase superfamily)
MPFLAFDPLDAPFFRPPAGPAFPFVDTPSTAPLLLLVVVVVVVLLLLLLPLCETAGAGAAFATIPDASAMLSALLGSWLCRSTQSNAASLTSRDASGTQVVTPANSVLAKLNSVLDAAAAGRFDLNLLSACSTPGATSPVLGQDALDATVLLRRNRKHLMSKRKSSVLPE